MRIIHSSGKELKLEPGTVLEMERTNPFFNDYGEQSLPVKLPNDPINRQILKFPDDLAVVEKMPQRADAVIQEGAFHIRCRQAILSAGKSDKIDSSFYLNIGSFYEKMEDLKLSTVFANKRITFSSAGDAILFVRDLMVKPDDRFACFPVLIEHQDTGEITALNRVTAPIKADGYFSLYNEMDRTETIDEKTISVPAGFYITPFIRSIHLLEELFKYLGYSLQESFFSRTDPFRGMVFLNNNIDTIVNAEIRYDQLVPDCTVSTILDIFRNKFCCEFIPDETQKTIRIVLFKEVLAEDAKYSLTDKLTSFPVINHAAKYKQVKLSADKGPMLTYSTDDPPRLTSTTPDFLSKTLPEIASLYPDAIIDSTRGWVYREGFSGDSTIREVVGCMNCDYFAGGNLETEKKESPDVMVNIEAETVSSGLAPFVGLSRTLNSSIILDNEPRQSSGTSQNQQDKSELKPMLCFVAHIPSHRADFGTIYAHYGENERLWDYALCYNGPDGLFEKFWREYDDILRNSMRPVTVKLLLSDIDKIRLSAFEKVLINNQELLPNIIKYVVGKQKETECTFLTTKLYLPISSAKSEGEHFPSGRYRWLPRWKSSVGETFVYFQLKETPPTFYPGPPTEEQYRTGGRYFEKVYPGVFGITLITSSSGRPMIVAPFEGAMTIWLEPVLREY